MLQKQKDLDPATLKGKKLRTEGFYHAWGVSILLVFMTALCYLSPIPDDARLFVTLLCALELPILLIAMLGCRKKIFFVITEDTLYFFHVEAESWKDSDSRKKTHYNGSGSVLLSEIRSMKVTYLHLLSKRRTPRLVLEGEGFTITATGEGRYVMWCIRKAQAKLAGMNPTAIPPVAPATDTVTAEETYVREGLFGEVWTLLESDSAPDFFDEGITITECLFREEDGMIDLFVTRNGQTISFTLDNEIIFMSDDDSDADETVELTEFADLADLQARMNHFVTTHTKSTLF